VGWLTELEFNFGERLALMSLLEERAEKMAENKNQNPFLTGGTHTNTIITTTTTTTTTIIMIITITTSRSASTLSTIKSTSTCKHRRVEDFRR
jgi:hypothetical protein